VKQGYILARSVRPKNNSERTTPRHSVRALICGINGQDGSYLARLLLTKGYQVLGTSRDAQMSEFRSLKALGVRDDVTVVSMAPTDFRSVLSALRRAEADEIYYLAGQTSVGLSFDQPAETIESIALGTLNILEAIRFLGNRSRLYHAGSSECFGDVGKTPAHERTLFQPRSPYAVAKASAHWLLANYREAYGIYACNGILFNHESPLRPPRFVTRKIVDAAIRIANGSRETLTLGRLDVVRDWGWAPEYVEAMWSMLQQPDASDYVIATGVSVSLEDFVNEVFQTVGRDWREHVRSDESLFRPSDIAWSAGDPSYARSRLGWQAQTRMPEVAVRMTQELAVSHS
jgi:GDPmannose 4,6-dehydratase